MTPTIEEVKRVYEQYSMFPANNLKTLQAFAQHYIEVGARSTLNATHVCRSCSVPYTPIGDNEDCPYCGCDGTDEWLAIRNNTGE